MAGGWFQDKLLGIVKKQEKFKGGSLFDTYERHRPAEGRLPSWDHLFVLGNVDYSNFRAFRLRLNQLISKAEIVTAANIHDIGNSISKPTRNGLSFTKVDTNRSDLCNCWEAEDFHRNPKDFVQRRMKEGLPLEFCYRTAATGTVSIRHAVPWNVFEDYFQARSHLGIRNYSYGNIEWMSNRETITENFLSPPYAVLVTMDNSKFKNEGSKLKLIYGILKNDGLELNIPEESHPEDKDASLLYYLK